jgi:hypothetical protein
VCREQLTASKSSLVVYANYRGSSSFFWAFKTPQTNLHTQKSKNMSSTKRKSVDVGLQRRVRARWESSEEVESVDSAPSLNGDQPASQNGDKPEDIEGDSEVPAQLTGPECVLIIILVAVRFR